MKKVWHLLIVASEPDGEELETDARQTEKGTSALNVRDAHQPRSPRFACKGG
jgi:hypothetical protein